VSTRTPAGFAPGQPGHQDNAPRALSLTFDDGPDETWTPLVLEQLEHCKATATFFMVGVRVLVAPAVARTVIAAGHEVQLHCHHHIRHTELTETDLQLDTELALAALASVGVRPLLWRTPWGVATRASRRVAERMGLRLVRWSIDTHDWRGDDAGRMLAQVRPRLADRATVLMHDALGPGARRSGCQNTLALLPPLTAAARAQDLKIVPMRPPDSPTASARPMGAQA
jgi:peptidoglycan-N-acetylglucosamine deacetylase